MSKTQRCNNVRFWSEQRPSKYNIDTTLLQRLPMSRPKENKKKKVVTTSFAGWEHPGKPVVTNTHP